MKRSQYFIKALTLGALIVFFSGCKKQSIYHDYVNATQSFNGSAVDYLKAQPTGTFDSLLLVLDRFPDLKDSLQNQQVTLFAPVNKSFEASVKYLNIQRASEGKTPIYLATADADELYFMLTKYIIRGNRLSDTYAGRPDGVDVYAVSSDYLMHIDYRQLTASGFEGGGPASLDYSDTYGSLFRAEWTTTKANAINIKTTNATINILTPLHGFGFDEFTYRLDN